MNAGIRLEKAVKMGAKFFEQLTPEVPLLLVRAAADQAIELPAFDIQELASVFPNLVDTDEVALGENLLTNYVSPRAVILPVHKTLRNSSSLITLGRSEDNDIRILDSRVSKVHCYFLPPFAGGDWRILDRQSTNGTFLEGRRLNYGEPGIIQPYREIVFSHVSAVFLETGDLNAIAEYAKEVWDRASGTGPISPEEASESLDSRDTLLGDDSSDRLTTQRLRRNLHSKD